LGHGAAIFGNARDAVPDAARLLANLDRGQGTNSGRVDIMGV